MPVQERVGVAGALALAGWLAVSSAVNGRPLLSPALAVLALAVAAYVLGRFLRRREDLRAASLLTVAFGCSAAVLLSPDGLSGRPLAGPLGYGNANGALCLLACVAATAVVADRLSPAWQVAGGVAALLGALLATQTGSRAAAVLAALVLAGSAAALFGLRRGLRVLGLALPAVVLLATVLAGADHEPGGSRTGRVQQAVDAAVSERRVVLWSESLLILADRPVAGVGPGGFAQTSLTALDDPDARWSHSLVLQQAAETGAVGALLLLGLLAWVLARVVDSPRRRATVAVIGLGALLAHAGIDYLAHFPALVAGAALVAGLLTARVAPRREAHRGRGGR